MKKETIWDSKYFCGKEISPYGLENGYVDYKTLASCFDAVSANGFRAETQFDEWELVNGSDCCYYDKDGNEYDSEEEAEEAGIDCSDLDINYNEYYQEYIISESGYRILSDYTNETIWYSEKYDLYVWGVTHYGTAWDYVLTGIKVVLDKE